MLALARQRFSHQDQPAKTDLYSGERAVVHRAQDLGWTEASDVAVFADRVCDPGQRVDTPFARSPGFREHLMIARGRAAFVVLGQFAGGLCGLPCP